MSSITLCIQMWANLHLAPSLNFFTGWMPFLLPNQQHQSIRNERKRSHSSLQGTSVHPESVSCRMLLWFRYSSEDPISTLKVLTNFLQKTLYDLKCCLRWLTLTIIYHMHLSTVINWAFLVATMYIWTFCLSMAPWHPFISSHCQNKTQLTWPA